MKLRLEIKLSRVTKNLFAFVENVHRLCENEKNFNFGFIHGNKLYLDTCNGLQSGWFICVREQQPDMNIIIATLNYAIALNAKINLSLEDKVLYFDICSKDNTDTTDDTDSVIRKVILFANSLELKYDLMK